jgi:hypothetical protein
MSEWTPQETNTHQHHVVAHVVGATVLGYFQADDALHMLLDIGFVWTIYLDAEMGLLAQSQAMAELGVSAEVRRQLVEDADALYRDAGDDSPLSFVTRAPAGCLIEEVELYVRPDERRLLIRGEEAMLSMETSLATGAIRVEAVDGTEETKA